MQLRSDRGKCTNRRYAASSHRQSYPLRRVCLVCAVASGEGFTDRSNRSVEATRKAKKGGRQKTAPWQSRPVPRCAQDRPSHPRHHCLRYSALLRTIGGKCEFPCPSLALRRHTVTCCHCFGLGCGCTASLFLSGAVECPLSTSAVLYGSAAPYKE